jgi:peptide/nickel transport system substrate-binding protein
MTVHRAAAWLLAATLWAGAAQAETVLKVAASEDLRALDPTWTTADATQNFSYLVYETLFSLDHDLNPQPQMVESFTVSPDALTYDFVLRPGLAFHDGSKVTSADVIASLKRWAIRAVDGRILAQRLDSFAAIDERHFTIRLKQPFSMLLTSLGNPASTIPIIMRAKDAEGDPNQPVRTSVGSGPFVFEPEKWITGSSWRFHKNLAYVPRSEPPSGMAGGRVAHVDAVEFSYIPDPTTALNALRTGQIDIQQVVPYDLIALLRADKSVAVKVVDPFGFQALIRPNALVPPFNTPSARRALLYLAAPADYLSAMVGTDSTMERSCLSPFMCGPGLPQPVGEMVPDPAKAKALLKEAGYKGETVVVLAATDLPELYQLSTILSQRLTEIGVKVDQQNMDFGTLATRRANMEDPATNRGGWSLFATWRPRLTASGPIINSFLSTSCDRKNFYGWPCDEALEKLRLGYLDATSEEQKRSIMDAITARFDAVLPYIPIGNFSRPLAYRTNIGGILEAPVLVLWNVTKQ